MPQPYQPPAKYRTPLHWTHRRRFILTHFNLSDTDIRSISEIIVGDAGGFYPYISGPKIVETFNTEFGFNDSYEWGNAPTRWRYAAEKIRFLLSAERADEFFSHMLSHRFMMARCQCGEVKAREKVQSVLEEFKRIVKPSSLDITGTDGNYHLVKTDNDLIFLGKGGFAQVYYQKSTGLVVKKLKRDLVVDESSRHRFKREFKIMKSLFDVEGVLNVYDYSREDCSYTMETGDATLSDRAQDLTDQQKIEVLRELLQTMGIVHSRNIIHRDISPTNIFFVGEKIKVADFGLGKNLETLSSYRTSSTNNFGQYYFCAPEQLIYLKDGDKRSDVYSLGRLINYVMTGHPAHFSHRFRGISEKATSQEPSNRYKDANELLEAFDRKDSLSMDENHRKRILNSMKAGVIEEDSIGWILEKNPRELCDFILKSKWACDWLIGFAQLSSSYAAFVIDSAQSGMKEACGSSFEANDPFADIAFGVLMGKAPFDVKERACRILSYAAWTVNRFHAQDLIKKAENQGIDPMLEDLLRKNN